MQIITAKYLGNRLIELPMSLDLPQNSEITLVLADNGDNVELRKQFQQLGERALAKLWDNEEDDVWYEYL